MLAKLIDYVAFTPINNVGGGPAISLPHCLMAQGLPGSVQLSAPRGGERILLQLAYELEATSPFRQIVTASSRKPTTPTSSCDLARTARNRLLVEVLDYFGGTRPLLGRDDEIDVTATEAIQRLVGDAAGLNT